jgi:hypothetical protein
LSPDPDKDASILANRITGWSPSQMSIHDPARTLPRQGITGGLLLGPSSRGGRRMCKSLTTQLFVSRNRLLNQNCSESSGPGQIRLRILQTHSNSRSLIPTLLELEPEAARRLIDDGLAALSRARRSDRRDGITHQASWDVSLPGVRRQVARTLTSNNEGAIHQFLTRYSGV